MHNYVERQYPPIIGILSILLLAPAVSVLFYFLDMMTGLLIGLALSLALMAFFWFSSPRIVISGGNLKVGRAQIPVKYLGETFVYKGNKAWEERGPKSDPNALLGIRGGIDPVVKIVIDDERDPTPYWLVSTRKPEEFLDALKAK